MSQPITRAERRRAQRVTTQQKHPWRASLRTGVLEVLPVLTAAAIFAGPEVAAFIERFWPGAPAVAWITGAVLFLSAASSLLAALAAHPAVDRALELIGLGSAPEARS